VESLGYPERVRGVGTSVAAVVFLLISAFCFALLLTELSPAENKILVSELNYV